MKNIVIVALISLSVVGCSSLSNDIERFSLNVTNNPASVICYSGGTIVLETVTKGKVTDDPSSDGFFFEDKDGNFIEVNADCIFKY